MVAAGAALVIGLPYAMSPYRVYTFTMVAVFAIATMGVNLLTGYNGQISLGHSFFFAVGAYTSVILMQDHGWNYLLTLVPAFILTFVLGFLFGIPALRLEGLYLALVTLALAVVAPPFIKRFDDLTGGSQGIVVRKPPAPEWSGLADDQWRYFVTVAVAVVLFGVARNLVRGRIGRALIAIRDNHIAAETMGIDLAVFKTLIFAYSAAFAGVAGALFAWVVGFVSPESFTVLVAIEFLTGAVVGGLATVLGPVFGAFFSQFGPVYAANINPAAPNVIYGIVLILVMIMMPTGVVGLLRRVRDMVIDRSPRPPDLGDPTAHTIPTQPAPAPEPVSAHPHPSMTRGTT
ncbi:MAG: branched-chain amino acid ABC transporter permease [Acidimicrobiia bacterium]|nr:branched-chain amino acid ABC transporter permease [Acidimicrobiia bacterium]